jgi:hypothetical protein
MLELEPFWLLARWTPDCSHYLTHYDTSQAHVTGTFGPNAEKFMGMCTVTQLVVYGAVNDEVRGALKGFNPTYFAKVAGFARAGCNGAAAGFFWSLTLDGVDLAKWTPLAAEMVAVTKADAAESGNLRYETYLNDDKTKVQWFERYANPDSVMV